MSKPTEIQGLLNQVKLAAERLKARIYDLDDQIEALYARRGALVSGPLSKVDYLGVIRTDVQTKARRFEANLRQHLEAGVKISYPMVSRAAADGLSARYLDAGLSGGGPGTAEGAYYFYFEDAIVAGVERALEGKEWPTDAVPATARTEALQVIGGQIDTLTVERDALANELVSCGVTE